MVQDPDSHTREKQRIDIMYNTHYTIILTWNTPHSDISSADLLGC